MLALAKSLAALSVAVLLTPTVHALPGGGGEEDCIDLIGYGGPTLATLVQRSATPRIAALPNGSNGGLAAGICAVDNARDNAPSPYKTNADFVPVVGDDSMGFYCVYGVHASSTGGIAGNVCIYLFELDGGEVLLYGSGYGNIPGANLFDAAYDMGRVDQVLRFCMGHDPAQTPIRILAPHGHADHINPACNRELERLGYRIVEIAFHPGDFPLVNGMAWTNADRNLFRILPTATTCMQELATYSSPLGKLWVFERPGHTPGSIDLVIDVKNDPTNRFVVRGSQPNSPCAPLPGQREIINAHGNIELFSVPPAVVDVTPEVGTAMGGTPLAVTGSNFTADGAGTPEVLLDGAAATNVVVTSDTTLTCLTPSGPPGQLVDVAVVNNNGQSVISGTFLFSALPSLTTLTPNNGNWRGGTVVQVRGSGFLLSTGINEIWFGARKATSVVVKSDTLLTCRTPLGTPGTSVPVMLVNPNGEATLDNAYHYNSDLVITGATPPSATALGGTAVFLAGTSFTGNGATPTVTVGGQLASSVVLISDTSLSFVAPAGAPGTTVDVVLTNSAGSAILSGFRYRATPQLTTLAPSTGRGSGGTSVTLTGAGFQVDAAGVNLVRFGGALATQVAVQTDGRLTCVAPGGPVGTIVNVTVTNENGTASLPAAFTYQQPLELNSFGPATGSSAGGTTVTLTGVGFVDGAAGTNTVLFGGTPATQVSTEDDTLLSCLAPPGTPLSVVDVTLTNGNGSVTLPAAFRYNARPALATVAPNNGHAGSTTPVTLTGTGFQNDNAGFGLVVVGGVTATNVVVLSDTLLTCTFPPGPPGALVDVIVVNQNGSATLAQGFRYHTAPSVTSLAPADAPAASQPRITLNGAGFLNDSAGLPTISFGGLAATSVSVQSDTRVLCNAPAGTPGRTVDVVLANARGSSTLTNGYRYHARPALTSATPNRGSYRGGTQITLAGAGFLIDAAGTNTVTLGGVPATNVTVLSDTSLRCTTPPGTQNAQVDVVVTNGNGSGTLARGFSYAVQAPSVLAVTPTSGAANAPGVVQVTGAGFLNDSAGTNTVQFGAATATGVSVINDATLSCQAPPGVPGTQVNVVVTNANGSGLLTNGFRYRAAPRLTALAPAHASALGGATIQLTGAGFLNDAPGPDTVRFGGLLAANVVVLNDATLSCTLPAGPAGSTVDVVVSNANGSTSPLGLRYHAAPSLSALAPLFGPVSGGTRVTLTGLGFLLDSAGAASVSFGGRSAANVLVLDDSTIACDAPRGAAPEFVDVAVVNANGSAFLPDGYHYGRLPAAITSLEPASGPAPGHTVVTLHGQGFLDSNAGPNRVKFGDIFATNVITLDDATVLCTTPPGTPGTTVDVALNNNAGTVTLPQAYHFNARPTLAAVTPPEGPALGATHVTLSGSGFLKDAAGAPIVLFGKARARDAVVLDDAHITCTALGGSPGTTLDVTVRNANGQATLAQAFLVTGGPPVIQSIRPMDGPYVGGTRVDIVGTGFAAGNARVTFGGADATNLVVISDTHVSCVTPPGTLGASVTVSLTTKNGTIAALGGFTYGPILPLLTSARPDHGPVSGGTHVTLVGTAFRTDGAGVTRVSFGGLPASNVLVLDDRTVTCDAPAGSAGSRVDVVLTNDLGSAMLLRAFRYNDEPDLTVLTPTTGRAIGGTRVTLTGAGFKLNEAGTNTVRFGGVPALDVLASSDQLLSCTTPPGVAGALVDVELSNQNGTATLAEAFRYLARPEIDSVTPGRGGRAGGTTLTLVGHGFQADAAGPNQVTIGGVPAPSIVTLDDQTILCTTPARATSGPVDVVVTNANGSDTAAGGFVYFVPPGLTALAPARGAVVGGTQVTLTGTGFLDATPGTNLVLFGGVAALDVNELSDTSLTCTTPPGTPGSLVDVTLVNDNGLAVLTNAFRYTGAPVLTALSPNHGPDGGAPVTLTGSGFLNDSAGTNTITFGGVAATQVVVLDDATATCRAPAGTGGAVVDVRVTNANGSSTLAAAYRNHREPTLTNVVPARGPANGGTSVTLTGTGFQVDGPGNNLVMFGGLAASNIVVVSDTSLTCTSPSGAPNALVNLTLANANGSAVRANAFRYNALPVVASVAPPSGPAAGGNLVTLSGSGFGANNPGTNTVLFGALAATNVVVVTDTSLTCLAPAGTGGVTVDVSLGNANGSATLVAAYRYRPAPTFTALAPADGPAAGGTVVTLTGSGFADASAGTTVVTFAGVPATGLAVLDDAHVRCSAPAGTAGSTVAVALTNANGQVTLNAAFRYHARPTLTAVAPARGSSAASSNLTLTGSGFLADAAGANTVLFGAVAATNLVVVSDTSLTCTVAPQASGSVVDVRVSNLNGSALLAASFAFDAPAPTLASLAPTSGPASGGTSVTLTGTGFQAFSAGTNTVTFGGVAATNVVVVSDTSLTCKSPAGTVAATVAVGVTNVNGAAQLAAAFTYLAPTPILTALTPGNGPSPGGGTVTLTGSGFQASNAGTNTVTFGGVPATNVSVLGDTSLTCTVPAGAPGSVTVALSNANGAAQLLAGYRYNALPTLTTIAPVDGTALGGTLVTVRGTGFFNDAAGIAQVLFGGTPASSVVVFDDTRLTCRAPSAASGAIVTVTLANQNGTTQLLNAYRYHARPTLTDVSPASGPRTGGARVTLTGTGFLADGAVVNIVSFGGVTASSVSVVNDRTIQCNVPPGTGGTAVQVTVANVNGTALLPSGYRYAANPTLTALAPVTGVATGGTLVTLTGSGFQVDSPGTNAVTFGGVAATSVTVLTDTSLTCLTPAGTNGATVDVALSNANGASTRFGAFTYSSAAPIVTASLPSKGTTQGSTSVTLLGSTFVPGMTVTFGGVAATDVNVLDDSSLTCTTPASADAGWVDVAVESAGGSASLPLGFQYVTPPTLIALTPSIGLPAGGETVVLTGSGFLDGAGTLQVTFGDRPASDVAVLDDTHATCMTPDGPVLTDADIVLSNDIGTAQLPQGFRWQLRLATDLDRDGRGDLVIGTPGDDLAAFNAGAVHVFFGTTLPLAARTSAASDLRASPVVAATSFGTPVISGDLDGDGDAELIIGAPADDQVVRDGGAVYVFNGPLSASPTALTPAQASLTLTSPRSSDRLGRALALHDLDRNGFLDLLVGAPGRAPGTVYVYLGGPGGISAQASFVLDGEFANEGFAGSIAAGDLDGDGWPEIVVGAQNALGDPAASPTGTTWHPGEARIFQGGLANLHSGVLPWRILSGREDSAHFGATLAVLDFTGDGIADLAVGSPASSRNGGNSGAVFVFAGRTDLASIDTSGAAAVFDAETLGDQLGTALAATDIDQDGLADLIVGAPGFAGIGRAYLLLGSNPLTSRSVGGAEAVLQAEAGTIGEFGATVGFVDVDGNGRDDVVVTAPGFSGELGRVYVFDGTTLLGGRNAAASDGILTGKNGGDRLGQAMTSDY